jgi:hypothetical protein
VLDPKTIRSRLAFLRHLYRLAVEQADQPEPLRGFSVLTFHDAVGRIACLLHASCEDCLAFVVDSALRVQE